MLGEPLVGTFPDMRNSSNNTSAAPARGVARAVAFLSVLLLGACATVHAGADFAPGLRLEQAFHKLGSERGRGQHAGLDAWPLGQP